MEGAVHDFREYPRIAAYLKARILPVFAVAALTVGIVVPAEADSMSPALVSASPRLNETDVRLVAASQVAADEPQPLTRVRAFPTYEFGVPIASGLAYDAGSGTFFVIGGIDPATGATALSRVSTHEDDLGSAKLSVPPSTTTFATLDSRTGDLILVDGETGEFSSVSGGNVQQPKRGAVSRTAEPFVALGAAGVAADRSDGTVYVLDDDADEILRIDVVGNSRRSAPKGYADLPDDAAYRGLALHPENHHLFVANLTDGTILEVKSNGAVVATYDLESAGVDSPTALVFAPSGDPTDDASILNLYVLDGSSSTVDATTSASIVEVSLSPTVQLLAADDTATLVDTVDTSLFSPPSPDPAGITYSPADDLLWVSDSEVNEMPLFAGVNVFGVTTVGTLTATGVTTGYSDEPTGLSLDPASGRLFVSDDDADRVYEVDPGSDSMLHTIDDVVTSISVRDFGSTDPEGVAFDRANGDLFVVDGLGREVYRVAPGPDGLFGGVDDVATSFDVAVFGAGDPEGIGYDASTQTLYVVDPTSETVLELTTEGALVRVIDISAALPKKAAGVTLAPGSLSPSETHLYIADRGDDNDWDPNENDGSIHELWIPHSLANAPPIVNAGPDQSVSSPDVATMAGTALDDSKPDPPAATTILWTQVAGPGLATFADATILDTTVAFSESGTYTLELTADDGELTTSDTCTVTVVGANGPFTLEVSIAAGTDDVEQRETGGIAVTSSDLELVEESSAGTQTVGLRFTGVAVPQGSQIENAYIQFQTDEVSVDPTSLLIAGEASDDAVAFTGLRGEVAARPPTVDSVSWNPLPWNAIGEAGEAQRTPDLAGILNEIVARPGWTSGNAVVLVISGSGKRVAEAFEGSSAPRLHIEYSTPSNGLPVVGVAASDASAREPADDGAFTFTRTGPTDEPLPVPYAVTGTATSGSDYVVLPGSVTIPTGQESIVVPVDVIDDADPEGIETVAVSLIADPAYVVGASNAATVDVADDEIIRFAAIGDYGAPGAPEAAVASLVDGFLPDFVVTLGDNAYVPAIDGRDRPVLPAIHWRLLRHLRSRLTREPLLPGPWEPRILRPTRPGRRLHRLLRPPRYRHRDEWNLGQ